MLEAAEAAAKKCGPGICASACVAPSGEYQQRVGGALADRRADERCALRPTGTQEHSIHSSDVLEDSRPTHNRTSASS